MCSTARIRTGGFWPGIAPISDGWRPPSARSAATRSSRCPTGIGPRRPASRPPCSTTCSIPTMAPSSRPSMRSRRSSTRPSPRCGRRSRRRNRTCWRSGGLSSTADFWSAVAAAPAGMFFEQPGARGLNPASPDLDRTTRATVALPTIRSALRTANFAGSASGADAAGFASAKAASHNDQSREGILESQPHDNVHGAMGGAAGTAFMVSFLSPVDPIFFLHHGNLDRLWDVWTRRQAALGRPTLPQGADLATWSNEQFLFFSDPSSQPVAKTNAGDYAAMSVFDYDYSPGSGEDQVPPPGTPVAAVPATRAFSAQITSATIGAGVAAGGIAEVPGAALEPAAPQAPPRVAEVTLNLGPADQGRRFRVLVAPQGGGTPIEAGGITIFSHHVHGPTTFTVPLPENLVVPAAVAGANVPLDIRVVPLEPPGVAPSPRARATATSPQVATITVRTS